MYVYKSAAESRIADVAFRAILLVAQSCAVFTGGRAPISACEPLCELLLAKASVLPAFARESKRGAFVREVEKRDEKRFGTELWR